ncbi:MAG: Rpn family recombination-promoting nuclease/putative transposase [Cytophagales bacterium]|nr:Rpn family recombination-promoting nuclease/putative transposase [Cytophagales bacterium]
MRFVDVKNDVAFRKIFGSENKKEILISFLNAVLKLKNERKIKNIDILNPFQAPKIKGFKETIIDIRAKDRRGVSFIIEMQVAEKLGFDKRVQFYISKEYSSQIIKGDLYPKLNQVVFIGILDFNYFSGNNYLTQHLILNTDTLKQELKDLEFNFIELPKFNKKEKELSGLIDKWVYFVKNAENLEIRPDNIKDKGLEDAYELAEMFNWSGEELRLYDYMSMRKQDHRGEWELFVERGIKKGVEKAEKKAEKAAGQREVEIVKEFYKNGVAIKIIANSTGLSVEKIKSILKIK